MSTAFAVAASLCAFALCRADVCPAQEQYPRPLVHTPTNHPAQYILLLSIDGLHAFDLARYVAGNPDSTLAELTARGVTYTNAYTAVADPAAGLVSLATGGTPISTGILSSDGFDHSLSPPGSHCRTKGAELTLRASSPPLDPQEGCSPVPPHALLRVNTIFEVVHQKYGTTAWAGENAGLTDLLTGPSGHGLDDRCDFSDALPHHGDPARVQGVLHWIDGRICSGQRDAPTPALFGTVFHSVAAIASGAGYLDAMGTPSPALASALDATDAAIARIVTELKSKRLYDSTWIVIASPYGLAPIDPRLQRRIPLARLRSVVESVQPGIVAHITGSHAGYIWLTDPAMTAKVARACNAQARALGIESIQFGSDLALTLNPAASDARTPDLILQPLPGVLWADSSGSAYGGSLESETHVALLISGKQLRGRFDPTLVPTTQLAPLLLRALGLEKFDLQALHREHSPALPGIF